MQAAYQLVDLAVLTTDLASSFRSIIEKAGMELIVNCEHLQGVFYADRQMWEKIVLNLLNGYSIANETPNTPTSLAPEPLETLDNDFTYLTTALYTKGLYIMQRFVLNTVSPIDIVINAYDKNGNIIASKTVP